MRVELDGVGMPGHVAEALDVEAEDGREAAERHLAEGLLREAAPRAHPLLGDADELGADDLAEALVQAHLCRDGAVVPESSLCAIGAVLRST